MFTRLVHRLMHFLIYAILFITRMAAISLKRMKNTVHWAMLRVTSGMKPADEILAQRCVAGQLLGTKKLNHAAIIVNNLEEDVNLPSYQ